MSKQVWETKPLAIWKRAKELRTKFDKSIGNPNALLGQGNTGEVDWSVGFPALRIVEDNPEGAMMAGKSDSFSRTCRMACEVRGWGRELCGYHGNCWGSMFLGHQMDGSKFPMRDFTIPFPCVCDLHAKRGQQARDLSPIHRWQSDFPMYIGPRDEEREKAMTEHRVYCLLKEINDLERVFGQRFEDEKLIAAIKVRPKLQAYAREVSKAMTNIPAPISLKDLYSFYTIGFLTKVDPQETLDFWKELRDEIDWRVQNQIAAVGTERYRWMEAHPSPWHFLKYYRYMEEYGAVCIGSQYSHSLQGSLIEKKADGTWAPREPFELPKDQPIRTREDAVRVMLGLDARGPHHFKIDEYLRPNAYCEFAELYKVDGAILPLWRGGVGCAMFRKEQALRLSETGIRVMHYEGSQPGDRTDLDENRFLDQLDTWMESQGLSKLAN